MTFLYQIPIHFFKRNSIVLFICLSFLQKYLKSEGRILESEGRINNSTIPLIDKNSIVVIIKAEQILILTIALINVMLTVLLSTIFFIKIIFEHVFWQKYTKKPLEYLIKMYLCICWDVPNCFRFVTSVSELSKGLFFISIILWRDGRAFAFLFR